MKLGTAGYMSPEQIRGEPLDARTDIFSFGLVLYEMATGERAFTGETEAILHDAIQHSEPKPVRELASDISPKLETAIERCLQKQPAERFQTATEMRSALADVHTDAALIFPQQEKRRRANTSYRRHRVAAVLTLIVLAGILGGVLYRRVHPGFRLTEKDTVVLADFENKTGDPIFDDALNLALRTELRESPLLNPLSKEKVSRQLKLMHRPMTDRITPEIAKDLCLETNSAAVIGGSIADKGNGYHIALRAVSCRNGDLLALSEADAARRFGDCRNGRAGRGDLKEETWRACRITAKFQCAAGNSFNSVGGSTSGSCSGIPNHGGYRATGSTPVLPARRES
jgi:hypothetical protein